MQVKHHFYKNKLLVLHYKLKNVEYIAIYHHNGNKLFECTYINDKKEGFEKWYYSNGKPYKSIEWLNNKPINKGRIWTRDNKLIEVDAYKLKVYKLLWG